MLEQPLIAKRLYLIGESYSFKNDALASGLAISLFQDSIEQLIWYIVKCQPNINIKDQEPFTKLITKIEEETKSTIPNKPKILELNKARVNFKHYGILPAQSEAHKFRAYTYDFLLIASHRYLNIDFEELSLASLVNCERIKFYIKKAELLISENNPSEAIIAIAIARFIIFDRAGKLFPQIDSGLKEADKLLAQINQNRIPSHFKKITSHFEKTTRIHVATLAGGDLKEHLFYDQSLPEISKTAGGSFRCISIPSNEQNMELAESAIRYITETTIRLESVI